jgi:predicted Fe-Mo cluster-binding NifX family protein
MRIAIATYGEMISPRFDCASTLRVLEWAGNGLSDRREELLQMAEGCSHAEMLLRQNVSALLCGGIRRCDHHRLTGAGIDVNAGHCGPYLDVFREYLAGRLKSQPSWERPRGCGWGMGRGQGQGRGDDRPGRGGMWGRGQAGPNSTPEDNRIGRPEDNGIGRKAEDRQRKRQD